MVPFRTCEMPQTPSTTVNLTVFRNSRDLKSKIKEDLSSHGCTSGLLFLLGNSYDRLHLAFGSESRSEHKWMVSHGKLCLVPRCWHTLKICWVSLFRCCDHDWTWVWKHSAVDESRIFGRLFYHDNRSFHLCKLFRKFRAWDLQVKHAINWQRKETWTGKATSLTKTFVKWTTI